MGISGTKVSFDSLALVNRDFQASYISFTHDNVLDHLIKRDELPAFLALSGVDATVAVSNTGPVFPRGSGESMVVRYGRRSSGLGGGRMRVNDLGVTPDEVAGDNLFAGG